MSEIDRIQQRYRERDGSRALTGFWTLDNPVVLHLAQERERVAIAALARQTGVDLAGARLLDVGCGAGVEFSNYLRWGASSRNLVGVDLMLPRLALARQRFDVPVANASGAALPFADESFDIVCQSVVFSSIVDASMRAAVAGEMLRVLRPNGLVLWYDAVRVRGRDPHFRPVPIDELQALFPSVVFDCRLLTTDLGLLRRVCAISGGWGMRLFDMTGLFKTHVFALGRKP